MLETSAPQGHRGLGEVSGSDRNNHDFILVPNDREFFLRHQRLVVAGALLGSLS